MVEYLFQTCPVDWRLAIPVLLVAFTWLLMVSAILVFTFERLEEPVTRQGES